MDPIRWPNVVTWFVKRHPQPSPREVTSWTAAAGHNADQPKAPAYDLDLHKMEDGALVVMAQECEFPAAVNALMVRYHDWVKRLIALLAKGRKLDPSQVQQAEEDALLALPEAVASYARLSAPRACSFHLVLRMVVLDHFRVFVAKHRPPAVGPSSSPGHLRPQAPATPAEDSPHPGYDLDLTRMEDEALVVLAEECASQEAMNTLAVRYYDWIKRLIARLARGQQLPPATVQEAQDDAVQALPEAVVGYDKVQQSPGWGCHFRSFLGRLLVDRFRNFLRDRPRPAPRRAHVRKAPRMFLSRRLTVESLEERVMLTAHTWTGLAGTALWSKAANWTGGAPASGDSLVFGPGAAQKASTNDFGSAKVFSSITFQDSGYSLGGNPIKLSGGINSASSVVGVDLVAMSIVLNANQTFSIDGANAQVHLQGAISGSGFGITKSGSGTLILDGASADTYTGTTTVNAGLVQLDRSAGNAIPGPLTISAATVAFVGHDNQIADTAVVTVNAGAVLDLHAHKDTVGSLSLTGGTVATGAGVLTLGGNITANASAVSAAISGNLDLGGTQRTVTISDGPAPDDLIVSAAIGNGALLKAGAGKLVLSGASSYAGVTSVNAGTLEVRSSGALGTTAGGTTVAAGATLQLNANGLSLADPLTLKGTGVAGAGALLGTGGSDSWTGVVTLSTASAVGVDGGSQLTFSTTVGGPGSLTKLGNGTLILVTANSYSGGSAVNAGTLEVRNTTGSATGPGTVTVNKPGTLAGNGKVANVTVNAGAFLSPGSGGPAILATGSVGLVQGATFLVDLNGTTSGTGFDQVNVTGTVNLGGATLQVTRNFSSVIGNTFPIIINDFVDKVGGTFAGLPEGATITVGDAVFTIHYNAGDGNDVVLVQTGVVDTSPPTSSVSFPAAGGAYNDARWQGSLSGTATDIGPAGLRKVEVSIKDVTKGTYWNGIAFTSPSEIFLLGSGTTSWSLPLASGNLADGDSYTVHSRATDQAGNVQATPGPATFAFDKSAPATTASLAGSAGTNGWYVSAVTVTLLASDATAGVAATSYSVDGGQTWHNGASFTLTADGVYDVRYFSTDNAGNAEGTHGLTVKVDRTPPTVGSAATSGPAASGWYNLSTGAPVIHFTASDGGSGLTPGAIPADVTLGEGASVGTSVTIYDIAGNRAVAGVSGLKVDLTPPTVSEGINQAAGTGWYNIVTGTAVVTYAAGDNLSGVVGAPAGYRFGEGANQSLAGVTVHDAAGNVSAKTTGFAGINVDLTAPTITGTPDRAANAFGWYKDDVTVSFSVADNLSGVGASTAPLSLGEGANQGVTGTVADKAGNTATATVGGINIDKTAPGVTINAAPPALTNSNSPSFGFSGADPLSLGSASGIDRLEYWVDGGSHTVISGGAGSASLANLGEGGHTFSVQAFDKAGNSAVTSYTWVIDTTPPTVSAPDLAAANDSGPSDSDNITNQTAVTLSGTAEAGSAVTLYEGTTVLATGTADINGLWGFHVTLAEGTHTLHATATDAAGNTAISGDLTVIVDLTKPTLSLPADLTAEATGASGAVVAYSASAGDASGSGVSSFVATPASGGTFGRGTTTVNVTASDLAGNTAAGTFTVTVRDTTPPDTVIVSQPPALSHSASADFIFSGSDTVTAPSNLVYTDSLDGAAFTPAAGSSLHLTGLGEGSHTLQVQASDAAGNVDPTPAASSWLVDLTAPTITGTPDRAANSFGWYKNDVTVSFAVSDNLSGVATATAPVSLGEAANQSVTGTVTDQAGNTATASVSGFNIDKTAPAATITVAPPALANRTGASFTFSGADPLSLGTASGIDRLEYWVDGGSHTIVSGGAGSASLTNLAEGSHTFSVQAFDKASNSAATSYAWVIATTPPAVSAPDLAAESDSGPSDIDNITNQTALNFNGTAETGSTVKVFATGTSGVVALGTTTADGSGHWTILAATLAEGTYSVTATATDAAGNTSNPSAGLTLTVDTTAPALALPGDHTFAATSAAGAAVIFAPATATDAGSNPVITYSVPPGSLFALGTTTVQVVASDLAGNRSTGSFKVTVTVGSNTAPLFLPATAYPAGLSPGPNPAISYPTGTEGYRITTGDFDGNGTTDLAVLISSTSASVTVFLGDGHGGFSSAPGGPFDVGFDARSLIAADFNGDGRTDLAVPIYYGTPGRSVRVYLATGGGRFAEAPGSPVPLPHFASEIAIGDFNNDGKVDLVLNTREGDRFTDQVSVLLGTGTGGFSSARSFSAGLVPFSVAVGDFNADGKQDLVVVNMSNSVSVLMGDGNGGFAPPTSFSMENPPYRFAVGDFNGDGKPDLAVSGTSPAGYPLTTILLGNGTGAFTAVPGSYPGGSNGIVVQDFNGDGKQDLALIGSSSADGTHSVEFNSVHVFLGDGSGAFHPPGQDYRFPVGYNPRSLVAGDFNGDGRPDLATANGEANFSSVLLSTGAPPLTVSAPDLAPASDSGASNSDNITNQTALTFTGTAQPASTVRLFEGTTVLGTVTADINGLWGYHLTLAEGTHTLHATATDADGNTATSPDLTVIVDLTAPTLSLPADLTAEAASASGAVVTYGASASDPGGSGISSFGSTPASGSTFVLGSTTVNVAASDVAGNTAAGSFMVTVQDTTAPDTVIVSQPPALSNSSSADFSFSGNDTVTTPSNLVFQYSLDGGPFTAIAGSSLHLASLGEGSHTLGVRATDAAGNTDPTPAACTWTVDTMAPATTASLAGAMGMDGWYVSAVMVTLSATDATSGVTATSYSVDGGQTWKSGTSFTLTADGVYDVRFCSTDSAGNAEGVHRFAIKVVKDVPAPSWTRIDTVQTASGMTVSPDYQMLLFNEGPTILAADLHTGAVRRTFTLYDQSTPWVLFYLSPSGKYLATMALDNTLRITDYATGQLLQAVPFSAHLNRFAWQPREDGLVASTDQGFFRVSLNGSKTLILPQYRDQLAFTSDGRFLVANRDRFLDFLNPQTLAVDHAIDFGIDKTEFWVSRTVRSWAVDPTGQFLAASHAAPGRGGYFHIYRLADGGGLDSFDTYYQMRSDLTFSGDGKLLAAFNESTLQIDFFRYEQGSWVKDALTYSKENGYPITLSPDGLTLYIARPWGIETLATPRTAGTSGPPVSVVPPPDTLFASQPSALSSSASADFTFSGTDTVSAPADLVFWYSLDGGPFTTGGGNRLHLAGLGEGSHTLRVRASNAAGNADPTPATYTWLVDVTAPVPVFSSGPSILNHSTSASLSFMGTDPQAQGVDTVSGLDHLEYWLDDGAHTSISGAGSVGLTDLGEGLHTFSVQAFDRAGNSSTTSYSWVTATLASQRQANEKALVALEKDIFARDTGQTPIMPHDVDRASAGLLPENATSLWEVYLQSRQRILAEQGGDVAGLQEMERIASQSLVASFLSSVQLPSPGSGWTLDETGRNALSSCLHLSAEDTDTLVRLYQGDVGPAQIAGLTISLREESPSATAEETALRAQAATIAGDTWIRMAAGSASPTPDDLPLLLYELQQAIASNDVQQMGAVRDSLALGVASMPAPEAAALFRVTDRMQSVTAALDQYATAMTADLDLQEMIASRLVLLNAYTAEHNDPAFLDKFRNYNGHPYSATPDEADRMRFLESEIARLNGEISTLRQQEQVAADVVAPLYDTLGEKARGFVADYTVLQSSPDLQACATVFNSLAAPAMENFYSTLARIALRTAVATSTIPNIDLPYGIGAPGFSYSFDSEEFMQSVLWLRAAAGQAPSLTTDQWTGALTRTTQIMQSLDDAIPASIRQFNATANDALAYAAARDQYQPLYVSRDALQKVMQALFAAIPSSADPALVAWAQGQYARDPWNEEYATRPAQGNTVPAPTLVGDDGHLVYRHYTIGQADSSIRMLLDGSWIIDETVAAEVRANQDAYTRALKRFVEDNYFDYTQSGGTLLGAVTEISKLGLWRNESNASLMPTTAATTTQFTITMEEASSALQTFLANTSDLLSWQREAINTYHDTFVSLLKQKLEVATENFMETQNLGLVHNALDQIFRDGQYRTWSAPVTLQNVGGIGTDVLTPMTPASLHSIATIAQRALESANKRLPPASKEAEQWQLLLTAAKGLLDDPNYANHPDLVQIVERMTTDPLDSGSAQIEPIEKHLVDQTFDVAYTFTGRLGLSQLALFGFTPWIVEGKTHFVLESATQTVNAEFKTEGDTVTTNLDSLVPGTQYTLRLTGLVSPKDIYIAETSVSLFGNIGGVVNDGTSGSASAHEFGKVWSDRRLFITMIDLADPLTPYVIQTGDSLSTIAQQFGISDWHTIYYHPANAGFRKNHPDPNTINPGETVYVPRSLVLQAMWNHVQDYAVNKETVASIPPEVLLGFIPQDREVTRENIKQGMQVDPILKDFLVGATPDQIDHLVNIVRIARNTKNWKGAVTAEHLESIGIKSEVIGALSEAGSSFITTILIDIITPDTVQVPAYLTLGQAFSAVVVRHWIETEAAVYCGLEAPICALGFNALGVVYDALTLLPLLVNKAEDGLPDMHVLAFGGRAILAPSLVSGDMLQKQIDARDKVNLQTSYSTIADYYRTLHDQRMLSNNGYIHNLDELDAMYLVIYKKLNQAAGIP